ncbi:MAG: DUF11 domain-containing protein [Chloroflexi bacterium]|nr:DUF11 domain-containing protein [Chloroflexota bacterium]
MARHRPHTLLRRAALSFGVALALLTGLSRLALPTGPVEAVTGGPQDPVPVIEPAAANKTVVINLNFTNQDQVSLANGAVAFGRPPARIGNPPLLDVVLKDKAGNVVERYNEWHPLWNFIEDGGPGGGMEIAPSGVGTFPYTHAPTIRTMEVHDIPKQKLLATIDVVGAAVRPFCEQNPTDAICTANIGLTKGDAPDPVFAGTQLTYTLTVSNSGPNPAFSATLVDTLPAGVTYVSDDGSCTQAPVGTLTCGPYVVDPQETRQVKVTVKVDALLVFNNDGNPVTLTNLANAANPAGADDQPVNNNAQATTTARGVADLAITTFDDPNSSGFREGAEAGLPGTTIFIDLNGNGILDSGEPSRQTALDGAFTLKGVGAGDFRICAVAPSGRVATSPRCTGVPITVDGVGDVPKVIPLAFGSRARIPGCTGGTVVNTIVAIDPLSGPAGYFRPTDLGRPATTGPWPGRRLYIQPGGTNPITFVQSGELVSNALLVSEVNASQHDNLVLLYRYVNPRQTIVEVVAADGTSVTPVPIPTGTSLPNPLPTVFTAYNKGNGELYIFGVPKTADDSRFQDIFVITKPRPGTGFITTQAAIAGKVATINGQRRLQPIGQTCGDKAESSIFAGTPPTIGPIGAPLPVDDVADKPDNPNEF